MCTLTEVYHNINMTDAVTGGILSFIDAVIYMLFAVKTKFVRSAILVIDMSAVQLLCKTYLQKGQIKYLKCVSVFSVGYV